MKGWNVEVRVYVRYQDTDKDIAASTRSVGSERDARDLHALLFRTLMECMRTPVSSAETHPDSGAR